MNLEMTEAVPAEVIESEGKVYIEKEGRRFLIDNDAELYKKLVVPYKRGDYKDLQDVADALRKNAISSVVYITTRCNLKCPICYAQFCDSVPEMTLAKFRDVMEKNTSKSICISGGECTVREDLPEFIKATKDAGKQAWICTNGIRISDRKYLHMLKEAGLYGAYLSFDGFNPEIDIKYRGIELGEVKMKAFENLKAEKLDITLTSVISYGNEEQIKKIIDFARKDSSIRGIRFLALYEEPNRYTSTDLVKAMSKAVGLSVDNFVRWRKVIGFADEFMPDSVKRMLHLKNFGYTFLIIPRGFNRPLIVFLDDIVTRQNVDFKDKTIHVEGEEGYPITKMGFGF
jgi:sulfatase maturation enzyme AslB (radical SAM superfamily)